MDGLDKENTYVLLIGASKYPNWSVMDIPNVQVNIREVESLLSDPSYCGIPTEKIKVIEDENIEDTNNGIQEFFDNIKTRQTTVILYYSGHGLQSVKAMDDLFLATRNIREKTFEASSIKISELRRLFSECIAVRKILLLDCCYAGKITKGFMSDDNSESIAKLNDFEGTYIMAASSEYERAKFDPNDPNSPTKFTGKFVEVIKNGIESDDEYCTLNSIYNQIRSSFLIQKDAPKPVQIGQNNIGNFPIFKNKKFVERIPKYEQVWNKVIVTNTIYAYNSFIDQFPESKYKDEAENRIQNLEDEDAWKKTSNKNTIGGYRNYLTNYIKYADEARRRLRELNLTEEEAQIWQSAISENKIALFENYCNDYPNGRFLDEAKARITELIILDREEKDWEKVNRESILSIQSYIEKYPVGKYRKEADFNIKILKQKEEENRKREEQTRLKEHEDDVKRQNEEKDKLEQAAKEEKQKLQEEKLWQKLSDDNKLTAFNNYLVNYPNGKYSHEAKEKIAKLKIKVQGEVDTPPNVVKTFLVSHWKAFTGVILVGVILTIIMIKIQHNPFETYTHEKSSDSTATVNDTSKTQATNSIVPSEPHPMSKSLLRTIKNASVATPSYNDFYKDLLDSIKNAPNYQQQEPEVKKFVENCRIAKEEKNSLK